MKTFTSFKALLMLVMVGLFLYSPAMRAEDRSLSGDVVCYTKYVPGTTMGLDFNVAYSSPDYEYFYGLEVTIPAGFTVNSATSINGHAPTITGNFLHWDTYVYNSNGNYNFTINVTVDPSTTGQVMFNWHFWGDIWGAEPHHVYGSSPIEENLVGIVDGYVYNQDLSPNDNAYVGIVDFDEVMTDAAGYYRLNNVEQGTHDVYAFETGVNYVVHTVSVMAGQTTTNDYTLAPPLMVISPVVLEETMNPNEWRSVPISIVNGGAGDLYWTAEIEFGTPPAVSGPSTFLDISNNNFQPFTPTTGGELSFVSIENNSRGTDAIYCEDGSVWGNALVSPNNGYTSYQSAGYKCYQQFVGASDKFAYVTFWIVYTAGPSNPRDFLIEVYEANGNAVGTLVSSTLATLEGFATPEIASGFAVWQYTAEIPVTDMVNGFVAVQGVGGTSTTYWANTNDPAGTGVAVQNTTLLPERLSMCLGGAAGGGWLDLSAYEGNVAPNGGSGFVNALFDASGTAAGQVWTANINFTAQPDVSTTPVSVSMIIAGEPLLPVTEFTAELINMVNGQVQLNWSAPANAITFEYYLIRRNGQPIANTTNLSYIDNLPTYGTYYYTVSAVYSEGESVPAGPEEVIWLIPVPCFTPDILNGQQLEGYVWTGTSQTVTLTIENCGEGVLAFDFTDFNDPTHSVGFVKAVQPYQGQIAEGESMDVDFTFSAVGVAPGTYNVNVPMTTNALAPLDEINVPCYMVAYEPAIIQGHVSDCNSGMPLASVNVLASSIIGDFTAETDASGDYMLYCEGYFSPWGAYYVVFQKLGYEDQYVWGVNTTVGTPTVINVEMCEAPYPVKWVMADPNEEDTQCMVTWSLPMGPYEIIYDDGEADNYFAWVQLGGAVSVKFTPAGYPATVLGGRLYVGDGSYPVGGNFIGQNMAVGIIAADGPSGFPGTVIDSIVVTVNSYGWINFGGFNYTIESGNFYLAMWQLSTPPNTPPIGIDTDVPTMYRSYTKQAGQDWKVSTYQDFMLRATVSGPGQNVQAAASFEGAFVYPPKPVDAMFITQFPNTGMPGNEKMGEFRPIAEMMAPADRDLVNYSIAFVDNFDPNMGETPMDGDLSILNNAVTNNYYNYTGWGAKPAGFYAFAVKANYESSESVWAYSNVAAHLLDNTATFNVTLCDGTDPAGTSLVLQGLDYPYQHLVATLDASGVVVFDSVIDGVYNLAVNKFGYQSYIYNDIYIMNDYQLDVVLEQVTFPPRNLYVDPLTSIATWDEPIYVQVPLQTFEEAIFPPAGWSRSGYSWVRTNNGSSSFFTIPSGDGYYACYNDDAFPGNVGSAYLITPNINLTASTDYNLYFYSFFTGVYGGSAYVEYSTDGGATWEMLNELSAGSSWTDLTVDLSSISGQDGLSSVWVAFHYDDNNFWADGWAVDNVTISNGAVETVQGYQVFLDGGYVAETPVDVRTYGFRDLQYGETYTAAVAALYCTLSEKIFYTWSSTYLYPPRNIDDAYVYNTNEVPLMWNPPVTGSGVPMMVTVNEMVETPAPKPADGRTYMTAGETAQWEALEHDNSGVRGTDAGLNLAFVTSSGVDNDFSALESSLIAMGVESITVIDLQPLTTTAADLLEYDGVLFGLNTFFTEATEPVGNMLADYVDAGGKLIITSPINATGYTNLPIAGRLLDEGYFPMTTGGLNGATVSLGTFDPDSPIMEGVTSAGGSLTITCNANTDAELVASWNTSTAFVATKTITNPVVQVNAFVASTGFVTGDVDLVIFNAFNWLQSQGGGGGGVVPAGLVSFNVYRDGGFIGNVAYAGQKPNEFVNYVDNPVNPGTYLYDVAAVYDLGAFGFPGESGESATEGPDTVQVVWGYELPFMETWSQGTFGFNDWTPASSNWKINSQVGDAEPSAEFTWDPAPAAAYSLSLTSAPLNADMMTEGKIFFEFSVKLNDRNNTGAEKLLVEVYDGQSWNQVGSFANNGSFDWTFSKLDISQYAMSRVFQVRFTATGANSFDIISWFVDNIYVYRMCEGPTKLEGAEYDMADGTNGSMIKWTSPEIPAPPHGWIKWDDGSNFNGIGVGDPVAWSAAARWAANYFPQYAGTSVTQVSVFAQDAGFTNWVIKIWSGANAGTLIYSENVTSQINVGAWTTITLATPVPYDVTKELWVGYTVTQTQDMFPAGTDAGPAVVGFGDKVTLDGVLWENLSDFGLDYNWNIQAYVEVVDGAASAIMPLVDNSVYSEKALTLKQGTMKEQGVAIDHSNSSRSFTNFNVYRMGPGQTDYTLLAEVPWVEGQVAYQYFDDVAATPNTYCYKVTAVWESATDYCESAPAPAKFNPMDDYVCVLVTDVNDPSAEGVFSLYPNPANDRVNISSSQAMNDITVYNYVGQVIFRSNLSNANSTTLNTGSYDAGIYVVRINTESGVITRRVTITR